ncbi:hypothetical protein ICW40_13960, partial [Actinotalea ferrariae]|nr:hypothetical protein [Actinotalea ferrariae]
MSSPREPRPDEAAGPDDRPGARGAEETRATDADATTTPAAAGPGPSGGPSPAAEQPEGPSPAAEQPEGERSAPAREDVSLTGRPIDDGPVIGQLEPGGAPSTPPERAPLGAASTDSGTGQHAAARPYPPVVPTRDTDREGAGTPARTGGDGLDEPAAGTTAAPAPSTAAPSAGATTQPATNATTEPATTTT